MFVLIQLANSLQLSFYILFSSIFLSFLCFFIYTLLSFWILLQLIEWGPEC